MIRGARWTPDESAWVLKMWEDGIPSPYIAKRIGRSEDAVRSILLRLRRRGVEMPRPGSGGSRRRVQKNDAPRVVREDRDRRVNLPDTLESFFGDPKPGSGQSALEQMRR